MKKCIAMLLALVMVLSLGATVFAAEPTAFADVAEGSWYAPYVEQITASGLMNGVSGTAFAPDGTLSRAMFVTILYRAAGKPATGNAAAYTDVVSGSWYADAVAWAAANGIVTGYTDGRFGVNDPVTREQMMTILYRSARIAEAAAIPAEFSDTDAIAAYAKDAMAWGVAKGILTGSDGKLMPKGTTTRAQAAAVIIRYLEQKNKPLTRADLEKAIVTTAWAYFAKSGKMQYCSAELTEGFSKYYGGVYRLTEGAAPEFGTTDSTIYSVCSDYVYKTYFNGLNYIMFDSPTYRDAVTAAYWAFCEQYGTMLIRCANNKYEPDDIDKEYGVDPSTFATIDEARAFIADWKNNLRPGDVMLPYGHAMLYIGDGYMLDCRGGKYNRDTGIETFEAGGSVRYLYKIEDVLLTGEDPHWKNYVINDKLTYFAAIRPTNILVQDDGDGDLSNDVVKDTLSVIPASTYTREQYPMMEIDRTVNRSPFGTTFTGDKLTYKVEIHNKTTDPDYCTYRKYTAADYAGEDYKSVVVTEKIPAGTELVAGSISEGGTVENGIITWKLDIAAGKTAVLTYDVTVTAKQGETIVSGGGYVGDIPSNTIQNLVGGKKLSEAAVSGLEALSATPVDQWREKYNISALTADLDFAERIYAKAAGVQLELPTLQELIKGMYQYKNITIESQSRRHKGSRSGKLFVHRAEIAENCAAAAKMIVPDFYGGKLVYGTDEEHRINEMHLHYLEPGDILVMANTDASGKPENSRISVYLGNGKTASITNDNKLVVLSKATETMMWKAYAYDVFFLLRPSQLDVSVPYHGEEPAYGEEPVQGVTGKFKPLTEESKAKLQALATATDWTTRNTGFAEEVYERAGMDLKPVTKSQTFVSILKKIYISMGGDLDIGSMFQYLPNYEPSAEDEHLVNMMIPGYRGGPDMVDDGDLIQNPTVDQLEVGDVLFLGCRVGSHYWTGVYMGDGKILMSQYTKDGEQAYALMDFSGDPAAFTALLKTNPHANVDWEYFAAFRPCQGFTDLNTNKQ